jgi:hypothetical protein
MKELVELEASLSRKLDSQMRDIEKTKHELNAVRSTISLLNKVNPPRHQMKAKPETNGAANSVTNEEMRRTIASFRGEFESAQVTAELRKRFPHDKKIPKKIARVLYDLRTEGKLHAEEKKEPGSKRFIYRNSE